MDFEQFIRLLQLTISPMVLISGVGLLLLSVTNRLARPIDRARQIHQEIKRAGIRAQPRDEVQLKVLLRRCELLRAAIGLLVFSILSSVAMILIIIISAFATVNWQIAILGLLTLSVLAIFGALILFLYDVTLALRALKIEVGALPS